MFEEVRFDKPASQYNRGRNGYFEAHGISVTVVGTDVELLGITSKGLISSSARLMITEDGLDQLIRSLQRAREAIVKGKVTQ